MTGGLVCGGAHAHSTKKGAIHVVHPWAFEAAARGSAGVGMKLENSGGADRLVAVATEAAERAELVAADGTPLGEGGLAVPARETIRLSAEGAHIRLSGLKGSLVAYDMIPMTLSFEKAGEIAVEIMIEERHQH